MKLLVCATEYYPYGSGIANVAYNVVEQLKKKGVDCVVCSPTGPDLFLGSRKSILKYGRIGLLYFWCRVYTFLRKSNEYDIVWLHQPLFLLKFSFLKSITTMHITSLGHFRATKILNYPFNLKIYYFASSLIENICLKKIYKDTKFVVDSPQIGAELSEATGYDINFKYIPNGVATTKFKPLENKQSLRRELQIPIDKKVFLAVGRLSYPKKLFTMVTVFDKLHKKVNNCVLIICGNGELEDQLKDYVRGKDIQNVEFRGFIPHDELPRWYGCADYYITTSGYEGQPLTLLEAMACGLPCIVSNIPNMQIVDDAKCGIVIDFSDKEHAAKKIMDYIMQDNSKHSINARKYAVENLDWNIIANQYLEEFYI